MVIYVQIVYNNKKHLLYTIWRKIMRSKFFISNKLRRKIEKDIKKRKKIEDSIKYDLKQFNDEIDDQTVLSTFKYIEEHGNKNQNKVLKKIEERYNKSKLKIEDTLNLMDWYDKMCDFYNNN